MDTKMHYTKQGYRINLISKNPGYNWLFLPGGPGLGSEYLIEFCNNLKLPGNISLLDFPRDGTNTQGELGIKNWKEGLIDLLKTYSHPILVTHSFSGMLILSMPEIESHLAGLVLMNTTTQNSFFQHVSEMREKHALPDLVPPASQYHLNPSNETYKEFWNTYKYYCFTPEEISLGEKMIPLFAFNNESYHYAIQHFYPTYECRFHPRLIPTMTLASENDFICPPQIFIQDEKFQSQNIINKIINKAGHCPWVMYFDEVQRCFDEFVAKINNRRLG
jgi:pimeloyl-ACP methyl ester carboxylesterase